MNRGVSSRTLSPSSPRTRVRRLLPLLLFVLFQTACVYRMGSGLMAGALDEAGGRGESVGLNGAVGNLLEKEVVADLGYQLGNGLMSGATEITPEQQADLERAIDGVVTVALLRAGEGLRDEVSPELREMVRKDIVVALAEGMRGELGASMEETVDRVVQKTADSVKEAVQDPELEDAVAALLRDAIYSAIQESRDERPGVGETLETTLTQNLLSPFERSIGTLTEQVADRVDESAQRTQQVLTAVISALIVLLGIVVFAYSLQQRQLRRERQAIFSAQQELRTVQAALAVLDESSREKLRGKLEEYQQVAPDQPKDPMN